MNMRLAGGVCAVLLLAGCSSGPDTPAATAGGKVSIKAASMLPEREMQKACEAIFGPANEVSRSLVGEADGFTWEADELNFNGAYGVSCKLTAVGQSKPFLTVYFTDDPTIISSTTKADAVVGKISLVLSTRGAGALSDQAKNALDELVNKAKERIAD